MHADKNKKDEEENQPEEDDNDNKSKALSKPRRREGWCVSQTGKLNQHCLAQKNESRDDMKEATVLDI